jgi:hypothetical protein
MERMLWLTRNGAIRRARASVAFALPMKAV